MPTIKLTLSVDSELVQRAKDLARERGTSLGVTRLARRTRTGGLVKGVSAAWMPPSSLQGSIHGVPWSESPSPVGLRSGRRVMPNSNEFFQLH